MSPADRNGRRAITAAGFPLVAVSAALWGTDALFRRGLALELPATTVVVWEHLILTLVMLPVLIRLPWRSLTRADVVSLVLIGAGASALATGMFTAAFRFGDPNAPLLLQKLQPVAAIIGARLVLGERPQPRFGLYVVVALAGAWLIAFENPLQVEVDSAVAGALAAGAAVLWAMGTVLGRRMTATLRFKELTAARFAFGLPAALLFFRVGPEREASLAVGADDLLPLVLLALIPGLLALLLYYRGLRETPASAATIAELAFPIAALSVNYLAFGTTVTWTQSVGIVVLSGTLVTMSVVGRERARDLGIEVGPDVSATRPLR